jgi:hypothetical protein
VFNMEFMIGALTGVLFFICVATAYAIGTRKAKTPSKVAAFTEEEQRKRDEIKRYNEHFKKLFSYDVDTALQKKKVM